MIEVCHRQLIFAEGLIAEEVGELWEDWMRQLDEVLTEPWSGSHCLSLSKHSNV